MPGGKPVKALTRKQTALRIQESINRWADFLGIKQTWILKVEVAEEVEGDGAETSWTANYRDAKIKFLYKRFSTAPDEELELYVLHELFHLVLADLEDSMVTAIGKEAVYKANLMPHIERLCDMLAGMLLRMQDD